jgi:UDP-3-O-[3-hydroxymyristoyl] glucosamine N-acyltransferase
MLGAKAGVMKDVEPGQIAVGIPALPHREFFRIQAVVQKLPELKRKVIELEKEMEEIKKRLPPA